jgi:hypothetical protein
MNAYTSMVLVRRSLRHAVQNFHCLRLSGKALAGFLLYLGLYLFLDCPFRVAPFGESGKGNTERARSRHRFSVERNLNLLLLVIELAVDSVQIEL